MTTSESECISKRDDAGSWRTISRLALPYRRQFSVVMLLALIGTGADLVEPLIYRAAVNDVAGLFVDRYSESQAPETELPAEPSGPTATPSATLGATTRDPPTQKPEQRLGQTKQQIERRRGVDQRRQQHEQNRLKKTQEVHRSDYVAPRTPRQTITTLWWAVALLFATGVTGYFFSLMADNRSAVLASRIEADLIHSTFGHVLRLPLKFFSKRASGGLAKQIDQSDQVAPIVTAFAQQIAPEAIRMVGVLAIMLTQAWRLSLVALFIIPFYLLVVRRSARRLETGLSKYYQKWERVSARIQEALAAIKTVKLSGAESREATSFKSASQAAYDDYLQRNRLGNRYLFWQVLLSHFSKALVFGYGGWMVMNRQLTPGDVVMFVAYLDRLYDPIDSLSSIAVRLQGHLASLRRALRLLKTGKEEATGQPLKPGPGKVEFKEVHFGYAPEREVLRGLSFTLEPGKVTALVGASGAGKTTTVDLLLRLYGPSSGEVCIDGQSLTELDPLSVRREVGVVAADGAVFRGALSDNIRYKRPVATDEEVYSAALAAGLGKTLERLPRGLFTEIGEGGVGLSVGERQRLQIARILVGQPRILVLDEATANLDYATENEVKDSLAQLTPRPTMMVISHRFSMIKDADSVVVLEGGRVLEEGTPSVLRTAGGWFAQFAQHRDEDLAEDDDAYDTTISPGAAEHHSSKH